MFYCIEDGKWQPAEGLPDGRRQYFGLLGVEESESVLSQLGMSTRLIAEALVSPTMAYENHDGYDFISINLLSRKALLSPAEKVFVYIRNNMILLVCPDAERAGKILRDIMGPEELHIGFDRILSTFFEKLTGGDALLLEKMEQEISDLENALITTKKKNCVREIISLRKRLMALKRYYEQLLDVLDELVENENEVMHAASLRYFKIYSGKVERLYRSVCNLRDYVTQVRESYQAEVDISLNNIMKIFTVITAVFLPLTLIVGWYGMNLKMPEYQWPFGYPMVILLSIGVVILCMVFFKKNKWF